MIGLLLAHNLPCATRPPREEDKAFVLAGSVERTHRSGLVSDSGNALVDGLSCDQVPSTEEPPPHGRSASFITRVATVRILAAAQGLRPNRHRRAEPSRRRHERGRSRLASRLLIPGGMPIPRVRVTPLGVVGVVICLSCAGKAANQPPQIEQLTGAVTPPERTVPPEPLSKPVKALLSKRMASHVEDMSELVSAIMLLDYSRIITRGDKIAADINLARPISQDATELNASIPEKFFVRQDELKAAIRELEDAAHSANPYWVADAYGYVAKTCVRCHADFRPGS